MAKLPTVLGMGNKEMIVGKSKRLSGHCMLIVSDRKIYDWMKEKGEQKMNEFKKYLLAENDKLRQENIRLHDKVNELSEDVGYYKGVVNTNGYVEVS